MQEFLLAFVVISSLVAIFSFTIASYINIWIYYSADKSKYPFFPILNPLSIASYELMLNSIIKLNWKVENKAKGLKRISNMLRKFAGILLLLNIILVVWSGFLD